MPPPQDGQTPLLRAVFTQNDEALSMLIAAKANIEDIEAPLHCAAKMEMASAVVLLLGARMAVEVDPVATYRVTHSPFFPHHHQ
jgi:hypothetical protein